MNYSKSKGIDDVEEILISLPWHEKIKLIDFQLAVINTLSGFLRLLR